MKRIFNFVLALALLASGALAAGGANPGSTRTVSGNYSRDLYGPVDERMAGVACNVGPCIWGVADAAIMPITFKPPAGQRVEIVALRGDLIAWIKTLPGDQPTPVESAAGVLGGFALNSMAGSKDCDFCADGCPLYIQDALTEKQPKTRAGFNYENVRIVLDDDHVLQVKMASFLNTTGKPIHLELTYTIQYRFL